jgi:hypothetical protein
MYAAAGMVGFDGDAAIAGWGRIGAASPRGCSPDTRSFSSDMVVLQEIRGTESCVKQRKVYVGREEERE